MQPIISASQFQKSILAWFKQHGRVHLPWQKNKTPYRVWISEIMLQQTQVTTVIPYFERFMLRFPTIQKLAEASEDEVLHLWTGLGYYSRARNLHKTAKIIKENYRGKFPDEISELEELPGIGRSTAGAIVSIAFQKPAAILDGNVKRVLTRFYAINTWPGEKKTHDLLWNIAEQYSPSKNTAAYTQAMMDLGATICIRGKPLCNQCPLKKHCHARQQGIEKLLPISKPKKNLPIKQSTLLLIQHNKTILLQKRPPTGIWGGLWSLPEMVAHVSTNKIQTHCKKQFKFNPKKIQLGSIFRHTFSHFHLDILPALVTIESTPFKTMESEQQIWYNLRQSQAVGLPAPIKKLLRSLP
jgi:A/G-specific adenine glycosylase